jgi:hypothetical protein
MSVELLLFLALFIGLPLVQALIKASKKDVLTPKAGVPKTPPRPVARAERAPARPQASAPRPEPARPTQQAPRRPVRMAQTRSKTTAVPPVPSARLPQRPPPMKRRAQEPAIEEVLAVVRRVVPPARRVAPPRAKPAGLGSRADLRRSMKVMTILGPPRATSPYDWPPRAEG